MQGCSRSCTLCPSMSKPLRFGLVELSLSEPDRIVGKLLQPGVILLKWHGIESRLEGIGAISVKGYCTKAR
jgi:hypothetical protein